MTLFLFFFPRACATRSRLLHTRSFSKTHSHLEPKIQERISKAKRASSPTTGALGGICKVRNVYKKLGRERDRLYMFSAESRDVNKGAKACATKASGRWCDGDDLMGARSPPPWHAMGKLQDQYFVPEERLESATMALGFACRRRGGSSILKFTT